MITIQKIKNGIPIEHLVDDFTTRDKTFCSCSEEVLDIVTDYLDEDGKPESSPSNLKVEFTDSTGLKWYELLKNVNGEIKTMNHYDALKEAEKLKLRLPTKEEIELAIEEGFLKKGMKSFWSSSVHPDNDDYAFDFYGYYGYYGYVDYFPRHYDFNGVRLVGP